MHFIYMYMQFLLTSSTSFLLGKQVKTKANMLLDIYYGGSLDFMIGLHRAIDLHMQIPGHTKCQVDAGFAQIKKNYRR